MWHFLLKIVHAEIVLYIQKYKKRRRKMRKPLGPFWALSCHQLPPAPSLGGRHLCSQMRPPPGVWGDQLPGRGIQPPVSAEPAQEAMWAGRQGLCLPRPGNVRWRVTKQTLSATALPAPTPRNPQPTTCMKADHLVIVLSQETWQKAKRPGAVSHAL